MSLEAAPYQAEFEPSWDKWCASSVNGTFLHTRRFLGYHGDRFKDLSVVLKESGEIVGLFPAAVSPADKTLVVSHPGATYGGIVHQGWMSGTRMVEAIALLKRHYSGLGFQKLIYKVAPYIYHRSCAQDDSYALFRNGAVRTRCDLSCAVDLAGQRVPSERRRRGLKKALKSTVVSGGPALLEGLWSVVGENLSREHNARPVHSIEELRMIQERFPGLVLIRGALVEEKVEAGIILFNSPMVWHSQYIAASEKGYEISALDAVFDSVILEAKQAGARYFDFGTSNENGGLVLNEGLYRFKSEFGGGGVAHEFYELVLS